MKVLALGADDPAPDENTVISSEPVSILPCFELCLNFNITLSCYLLTLHTVTYVRGREEDLKMNPWGGNYINNIF